MFSKTILHDAKCVYRTHANVKVNDFESLFLKKYDKAHPYAHFGYTSSRDYLTKKLGVEVIKLTMDGSSQEEFAVRFKYQLVSL